MLDIHREEPKSIPTSGKVPLQRPFVPRTRVRKNEKFPRVHYILPKDKVLLEKLKPTGFHGGPARKGQGYRLIAVSWAAMTIDSLLILALNMFLLAGTAWLFEVSARPVLQELYAGIFSGWFWVLVGSMGIYFLTFRMILGRSLGEWACHIYLGDWRERRNPIYCLRVILRCCFILCSGLVGIPILSMIFGQDLAGKFSGLSLVEK